MADPVRRLRLRLTLITVCTGVVGGFAYAEHRPVLWVLTALLAAGTLLTAAGAFLLARASARSRSHNGT